MQVVDSLSLVLIILLHSSMIHFFNFEEHVLKLVEIRHVLNQLVNLCVTCFALLSIVIVAYVSLFCIVSITIIRAFQNGLCYSPSAVGIRIFQLIHDFSKTFNFGVWNLVLLVLFRVLLLIVFSATLLLQTS